MMKSVLIRVATIAILTCCAAVAQNSDLGILFGVGPISSTVSAAGVSSSVSGSFQLNYAVQLRDTRAGLLYLELPFLIGGTAEDVVSASIRSSVKDTIFFTPGVRWKYAVQPRVALYGAIGGGLGSFGTLASVVGFGVVSNGSTRTNVPTFGFGGGIDIRLTRLLSLRAEGRDFVTRANLGDTRGHSHAFFDFGVGFHF
ncbi:MAG TPA: hypothetical protein VLY04_22300 [Bryobacteraceae bacterium]|nr:hypothetical protein [Bryobacteraceae bacterium]